MEGGDDVFDYGGGAVVEDLRGTQLLEQREVARGGRREHFVAGGDGELDRVHADAGRAAPDQERLAGWRFGRRGRQLQRQLVFLEEAAGGGGGAEGDDAGLLVGEVRGNRGAHVLKEDWVGLEGALGGGVDLL